MPTKTKTRARKSPQKPAASRRCAEAAGSALSATRAMQIVNNVVEEFADLGQTGFATKADLCRTIQWLRSRDEDIALAEIRQSVAALSIAKKMEAQALREIDAWLQRRTATDKQNTEAREPEPSGSARNGGTQSGSL